MTDAHATGLAHPQLTLHYQIARRDDLCLSPGADMVLSMVSGELRHRVCLDEAEWEGGVACHGLGFTVSRAADPDAWALALGEQTARANELLAPLGGRLLPGGSHPFMDPARETWIWNHDQAEVFAALDRVCGLKCQSWSNQGYAAIRVPYGDDADFGRAFAALRLLAAIVPALAASSPLVDGVDRGYSSERVLAFCERGAALGLPGGPLPGPAATPGECLDKELGPVREALARLDPEGLIAPGSLAVGGLRLEVESRSIVCDLADLQECPRADLAVTGLFFHALGRLRASDAAGG
ncbi:MAG: hypothetical protein HQK81_09545, partial [Desulfovibrionaceae bacterium]|nr:hypothetical protein [Desulfovibrionaceae bacterium]